jgi:hypothetical protein
MDIRRGDAQFPKEDYKGLKEGENPDPATLSTKRLKRLRKEFIALAQAA